MESILLIDDSPDVLKVLHDTLVLDGYQVDACNNGKAGLDLIKKSDYDLVISDILMPEVDGFEILKAIATYFPGQKKILMSGGGTSIDKDFLLETAEVLGANRILAKPIHLDDFSRIVKEVLEETT